MRARLLSFSSIALLAAACSGSDTSDNGDQDSAIATDTASGDVVVDSHADVPPPTDTKTDVAPDAPDATPSDDGPFATKRASCAFKSGDKPSATFGPSIA